MVAIGGTSQFFSTELESYVNVQAFIKDLQTSKKIYFTDNGVSFDKFLSTLTVKLSSVTLRFLYTNFFFNQINRGFCNIHKIDDLLLTHVQFDTQTTYFFDKLQSAEVTDQQLHEGILRINNMFHNNVDIQLKNIIDQGNAYNLISQFHTTTSGGPYFPAVVRDGHQLKIMFYYPVDMDNDTNSLAFIVGITVFDWQRNCMMLSLRNTQKVFKQAKGLTVGNIYRDFCDKVCPMFKVQRVDHYVLQSRNQRRVYEYHADLCNRLLQQDRNHVDSKVTANMVDNFINTAAGKLNLNIGVTEAGQLLKDFRTRFLSAYVEKHTTDSGIRKRALDLNQLGYSSMIRFYSENSSSGQARTGNRNCPLVRSKIYYRIETLVNMGQEISSWSMSWFWKQIDPDMRAGKTDVVNTTLEITRSKLKLTIGFHPNLENGRSLNRASVGKILDEIVNKIL